MVADILKTKIEAIDAECEAATRPGVNRLYAEARYDGSRFCVPSFRAASAIWLSLIAEKERRFIEEVGRVLRTPGSFLSGEGEIKIRGVIETVFSDDKYLERLRVFSEGVVRQAASYGLPLDLAAQRFDMADSAYRAGVMNAVRKARTTILAEIALHTQSNAPDSVQALVKWWRYVRSHPWKALGALVLLGLVPWLISKVSVTDMLNWIQTRSQ
jgi:hypothetical protein